jgi:hypothetical protein
MIENYQLAPDFFDNDFKFTDFYKWADLVTSELFQEVP